ncbi:MAG TPA: radical SAM protein [Spirochaetota bacterium]|jgi:putative pyruvate formate lyase activating enzyme|nr:MAG: Radical SAM superfamily protein [Spirochaetes bacterium ADurb.Bin133]HNZ27395.1 radical SAM protein [Spirochaetota bacterium]HPY87472.1 radical SAM protein [Spirochaetota bacterium]HQB61156.1 radical SAM protein [Spirochaetota bacterium]
MNFREYFIEYENCLLCPRKCGVNRYRKAGFCGETAKLSVDSILLHKGEEPPISFKNGSGTIFFTGCSLRCPFCQNMQISQNPIDKKFYNLKDFFYSLDKIVESGAENVNFVTPDHFLPHIIEGVKYLRSKGIDIPTVYNCSGYQSLESLETASEYMDIFLFDYKFADASASKYLLNLENYNVVALRGLEFLFKKKGNLRLDANGKALSGVIVRHLVMPDFIKNSEEVLNNLYFSFGNKIFISIMSQYSPKYLKIGYDKINRKLRRDEYEQIVNLARELNFKNGFIQDYIYGNDQYLPDFNEKNNFEVW